MSDIASRSSRLERLGAEARGVERAWPRRPPRGRCRVMLGQHRAPVGVVRDPAHEARALQLVDDVGHARAVDLQPRAHLAERQRAAAARKSSISAS